VKRHLIFCRLKAVFLTRPERRLHAAETREWENALAPFEFTHRFYCACRRVSRRVQPGCRIFFAPSAFAKLKKVFIRNPRIVPSHFGYAPG